MSQQMNIISLKNKPIKKISLIEAILALEIEFRSGEWNSGQKLDYTLYFAKIYCYPIYILKY